MKPQIKACKVWRIVMPHGALRLFSLVKKHKHMNLKKICAMKMNLEARK
jgi:hypothetical protein